MKRERQLILPYYESHFELDPGIVGWHPVPFWYEWEIYRGFKEWIFWSVILNSLVCECFIWSDKNISTVCKITPQYIKFHCILAELIWATGWSGGSRNTSESCAMQQQFRTCCVPSTVSIVTYVSTLPTPEQHFWPFPLCISACPPESEDSHLCYSVVYFAATTTSMFNCWVLLYLSRIYKKCSLLYLIMIGLQFCVHGIDADFVTV
jgi:hypothetical protein